MRTGITGRRLAAAALLSGAAVMAGDGHGAAPEGRADNPAFCFGYVAAASPGEWPALKRAEAHVRAAFAVSGPRDSTDERDFEDWRRIGAASAGKSDSREPAGERENVLAKCRLLLRL